MRNRSREISVALIMLLLAVLLVLAFLWALSIGTVKLSLVQIYEGVVTQFTSGLAIETAGHRWWKHLRSQNQKPCPAGRKTS